MGKQATTRINKTIVILLTVFTVAFLTSATVALAAPATTPKPSGVSGKIVNVSIQNSTYNPTSLQISAGDTVKWTNMDLIAHTVTGQFFNSGAIYKGQSYQVKFTNPGVYSYYCAFHPTMKGTLTVV